jgi:ketoreductase RED2
MTAGSGTAELDGVVAIVTGSSSGIGERTAQRLSELGASVVVNSSSSVAAGEAVAAALPGPSAYVQADIADADQCRHLLDATVERFGHLDLLVNNAGWTTLVDHRDLDALTEEIFRKTFEVNVFGTWNLTKMAMPLLRESQAAGGGHVVNVTSIAGVRPVGSSIAYSGPVRVNAVAPGLVATPWTSDWDAQHEGVKKMAPLKRSATPDDCAEAVLALVRNHYVTGEIFVVDGGLTQLS